MKKTIKYLCILALIFTNISSCSDYLDVVPDNVGTIDNAFTDEVQARKYLFTCYSFIPKATDLNNTLGWLTGDEFWVNQTALEEGGYLKNVDLATSNQSADNPLFNYHEGKNGGVDLYQGIQTCNTFISRIDAVRGMDELEKKRWKAEAKFLKAYYHYFLMRLYGPIILVDEVPNVGTSPEEIEAKGNRQPFDDCVNFVVNILDEAALDLPYLIENELEELGRITKVIALSLKSEVLLMAASPLFNGNSDFAAFVNKDGNPFFSPYDNEKWKKAVDAALVAIQASEMSNISLYQFRGYVQKEISDYTELKLTLRGRVTERWNQELIWGHTNTPSIQKFAQANFYTKGEANVEAFLSPTFRIVQQYYSKNGVPITEDKDWVDKDQFSLRAPVTDQEKLNVKYLEEIPELHYNREPRFYADLGFDRGTWFGQGISKEDENSPNIVFARNGETSGKGFRLQFRSITGYFAKKLAYYKNTFSSSNGTYSTVNNYPFPLIRLSDLYLSYAEALNEYNGPSNDVYAYVDKVRNRAGLEGVVQSWVDHAIDPTKVSSQDGLREIIRRERLIEFSFENHRVWDLRRWKLAKELINGPLYGWNVDARKNEIDSYYKKTILVEQKFETREYLWPFRSEVLTHNRSLIQNPGW